MSSEKREQAEGIFSAALDQEPEERTDFVRRHCREDVELRREVESLLGWAIESSLIERRHVEMLVREAAGEQAELESGKAIGHYMVLEKIGEGGMGEVYLARDARLNRRVALKLLPASSILNQDRLRRFEQEAYAASSLNHPNILTIHEIGQENGTNFIATEFVEGTTLRHYLGGRAMKITEVLDVTVQIASALAAAHQAGIVHRDIKPENIMLRHDGIVKVLDFGLAKLTEERPESVDREAPTKALIHTEPGTIMGTAYYMSPEQARGLETDARTDIWSLGVVLYEMVTGHQPFSGETMTDVLASIIKAQPTQLTHYNPEAPRKLEEIVNKALEKDKEERYQGIKDLLVDLRRLKKRMEFEDEIERSTSSDFDTSPTVITDSTEYAVSEVKQHKYAFVAAAMLFLLLTISGFWFFFDRSVSTRQIESIAVLPFQNATGDKETEFLSDGFSETLINNFTKIPALRVIARSTAFRYRGRDDEPKKIGKELNVGAILSGKVLQRGDALSVQVDLINAQDGMEIWGENYNGNASEILNVQQKIARDVSEHLRLKLSGAQAQQMAKNYTTNPEAYQFYLRGRFYWNKRTAEGIRKAVEEFQRAINIDPNYALGYVGLADSYMLLEEYAGIPASETLPKAKGAADRALQLDDSLAEAHASLGNIYEKQWHWAEAENEFKRAISLNPNYPTAHQWFGLHLKTKRQFDDAMRESKRAQELDPLSPVISGNIAFLYLLKNDINSAIDECRKIIELDPSHPGAYDNLGWAYLKQRRYAEAATEFQRAVELSGEGSDYLSDLGYCYAIMGRHDEAQAILQELKGRYSKGLSIGQYLASVYVGLGHKDEAFALLEKDFEQRSGELPSIVIIDSFDDLRSDPRYTDLIQRIGLQP